MLKGGAGTAFGATDVEQKAKHKTNVKLVVEVILAGLNVPLDLAQGILMVLELVFGMECDRCGPSPGTGR